MDAERAGKVINPGVLIGKGVISGEGSAGGCCGGGGGGSARLAPHPGSATSASPQRKTGN